MNLYKYIGIYFVKMASYSFLPSSNTRASQFAYTKILTYIFVIVEQILMYLHPTLVVNEKYYIKVNEKMQKIWKNSGKTPGRSQYNRQPDLLSQNSYPSR